MGAMQAEEMAAAAGEGEVSMRQALTWHLQSNHFPPVSPAFVEPAMAAIRLVADEDYDTMVVHFDETWGMPAIDIVEQLHLWAFVDNADAIPPTTTTHTKENN